jgi:hypothetical protein
VNEWGEPTRVHTVVPVPGVPELDQLLRTAVRQWRFCGEEVVYQQTRICSSYEVDFDVR